MYKAYVPKNLKLSSSLEQGLEFINWKKIVKKDARVFIKPNQENYLIK